MSREEFELRMRQIEEQGQARGSLEIVGGDPEARRWVQEQLQALFEASGWTQQEHAQFILDRSQLDHEAE